MLLLLVVQTDLTEMMFSCLGLLCEADSPPLGYYEFKKKSWKLNKDYSVQQISKQSHSNKIWLKAQEQVQNTVNESQIHSMIRLKSH